MTTYALFYDEVKKQSIETELLQKMKLEPEGCGILKIIEICVE